MYVLSMKIGRSGKTERERHVLLLLLCWLVTEPIILDGSLLDQVQKGKPRCTWLIQIHLKMAVRIDDGAVLQASIMTPLLLPILCLRLL